MEQLISYLKQPTVIIFIIIVFIVMLYNMMKVSRVKKQAKREQENNSTNNPINQEEEVDIENNHEGRSISLNKEDHSAHNEVKIVYHEKPPKGYEVIYKVDDVVEKNIKKNSKKDNKNDIEKDIFITPHAIFGNMTQVVKGRFIYVSIKTIIALLGVIYFGYDLFFVPLKPVYFYIELGVVLFLVATICYNWFYALSTITFYERGFVRKTFFKEKAYSYSSIENIIYERKGLFRVALERKQKFLLNITVMDFITAILGLNITTLEEVSINTLEAGKSKRLDLRGWNYFLISKTFQLIEENLIFSKIDIGHGSRSEDTTGVIN